MQNKTDVTPVKSKCLNCWNDIIGWQNSEGRISMECPRCGTKCISIRKSRRHVQVDMYAAKGQGILTD